MLFNSFFGFDDDDDNEESGGMTDYQFTCFVKSIRRELLAIQDEIVEQGARSKILDRMLHDYEKYAN
ncbi:MAG: hypothetical protein FWG68_07255 [Defluviitaleaceae bacterium]|nr:hypothetical protein [Defluviitaleaceae bacterium]